MHQLRDLTLLYVEDDTALREQFVRIFSSKFKKVYEAHDGEQALQNYSKFSPDMILIDINIPKINGLEVVEEIRKNDTNTPVVVLSAYSDQLKLLKAIKLGLSEYLIKPVPHKKLLSLFESIGLKYEKKNDDPNIILLKNGYSWKREEKILCHHDTIISLTKREGMFFNFMVKQLNTVATLENITDVIWGNEESDITYSALSHLLKRVRKKLPEELIENIYGEGYRIMSR